MTQKQPAPKVRKHLRPVCPEAHRYEALKAALRGKGLSPADYAQAVRQAAREAGL